MKKKIKGVVGTLIEGAARFALVFLLVCVATNVPMLSGKYGDSARGQLGAVVLPFKTVLGPSQLCGVVDLLPSLGPNKYYNVWNVQTEYVFGGASYNVLDPQDWFAVGTGGGLPLATIPQGDLVNVAFNQIGFGVPTTGVNPTTDAGNYNPTSVTALAGYGLTFFENSCPQGGNGSLILTVYYTIETADISVTQPAYGRHSKCEWVGGRINACIE